MPRPFAPLAVSHHPQSNCFLFTFSPSLANRIGPMLGCFTGRCYVLLIVSLLLVAAAGSIPIASRDHRPAPALPSDSITIHLIPHSHCDPGWLLTADQYFSTQVRSIIDTVIAALEANPSRRFIWSEVSYFTMWWRSTVDSSRARIKALVESGALEMVMGGWVMNDEALPSLDAIIDQCTAPRLDHRAAFSCLILRNQIHNRPCQPCRNCRGPASIWLANRPIWRLCFDSRSAVAHGLQSAGAPQDQPEADRQVP
jgi:hypothetical protein